MMRTSSLAEQVVPAQNYAGTAAVAHHFETSSFHTKKYVQLRERNGAQSFVMTARLSCDIWLGMKNAPVIVTPLAVDLGQKPTR
jgi:hypothetical protein